MTTGLFADIVQIAGTGRFLPYDKDRRWTARKDDHVLAEAIIQEPGLVFVPTLSTSRRTCIKIHIYSHDPHGALARAAEVARRLCREHDARTARLIWFLPPGSEPHPVAACTRIQMRTFHHGEAVPASEPRHTPVVPLDDVSLPVRATFTAFAEKLAADGFAFLDGKIRDCAIGPVLTCQRDGRIVGAIGPMEIGPDSRGIARLLPQYFGVLPEYRGFGFGRCLWQSAMQWGQHHLAAYQLLQTEFGGASDRLCRSEGLADLGLVCAGTL